MMTILHGENILASRAALNAFKDKFKSQEIISLDGRKTNLAQVKQILESPSIFTTSRLVIIENLLTTKKSANQLEIIDYLLNEPVKVELILWEEKEVSKTILSKFDKAQITLLKLEKMLFKFLESIRPNKQKEMLLSIHRCIDSEEPELVFYMMIRQFRLLIAVKDGLALGIEELDRLASWQKERLVRQAKYFSLERLVDLYRKLLKIDLEQKTGQNSLDLSKTLELFIINL